MGAYYEYQLFKNIRRNDTLKGDGNLLPQRSLSACKGIRIRRNDTLKGDGNTPRYKPFHLP